MKQARLVPGAAVALVVVLAGGVLAAAPWQGTAIGPISGLVPPARIHSFAATGTSVVGGGFQVMPAQAKEFILTDVVAWEHATSDVYMEFTLRQGSSDVAHFLVPGSAGGSPKPPSYHFGSGLRLQANVPLTFVVNQSGFNGNTVYVTLSGFTL